MMSVGRVVVVVGVASVNYHYLGTVLSVGSTAGYAGQRGRYSDSQDQPSKDESREVGGSIVHLAGP